MLVTTSKEHCSLKSWTSSWSWLVSIANLTHSKVIQEETVSTETWFRCLACGPCLWRVILINNWHRRAQFTVAAPSLGRWAWAVSKSQLSMSQGVAFWHGLCFSSCFQVPALNSCPDFPQCWTVTRKSKWKYALFFLSCFGSVFYCSNRKETRAS